MEYLMPLFEYVTLTSILEQPNIDDKSRNVP